MMNKQVGFTLVEFVIVLVLTGIVFAVGAMVLSQAFNGAYQSIDNLELTSQAAVAFDRLADDVRGIRSATSSDLLPAPTQLTLVDAGGQSLTYQRSGTVLMRGSEPLADHVTQLQFNYLDANGAALSNLSQVTLIRSINVQLTITQHQTAQRFSEVIALRNTF